MSEDLRDKPFLEQEDLLGLNFIRAAGKYFYRRHYRRGLRSHLLEVLDPKDVQRETRGVVVDGLRCYPMAEPLKMLRILRTRFDDTKEAEKELKRVKIIENYMAPEHMAMSEEFLVTYLREGKRDIILCGLQEYVKGTILDLWNPMSKDGLVSFFFEQGGRKSDVTVEKTGQWIGAVRRNAGNFVVKVKQMIVEANHVPDLAGFGNLLLTHSGEIKLVDINNVSKVFFDSIIRADDRGYPVCDKSIQALSLIERKLLDRPLDRMNRIYGTFLDPERMKQVQEKEEAFNQVMNSSETCIGMS